MPSMRRLNLAGSSWRGHRQGFGSKRKDRERGRAVFPFEHPQHGGGSIILYHVPERGEGTYRVQRSGEMPRRLAQKFLELTFSDPEKGDVGFVNERLRDLGLPPVAEVAEHITHDQMRARRARQQHARRGGQ